MPRTFSISLTRAGRVVGALAGMVLLAACRPQPGGRPQAESLTSEPAGQTTFYGVAERIRGFDPVMAGDVASALAISRIYEGLLQYAYLKRPYAVEPCLAAAL